MITFISAALLATTAVVGTVGVVPAAAATCIGGAPSDFNGDGVSDAVMGQPDPLQEKKGAVHIIYGTRLGLVANPAITALDDQLLTTPVTGSEEFGAAVTTGDFNGDGCGDLAVGNPDATVSGVPFAGDVLVYFGSPTGLVYAQTLSAGLVAHSSSEQAAFGATLASGDINGDGLDDIVIGAPADQTYTGAVFVFAGSSRTGQIFPGAKFREGDGTVPGSAEPLDYFGAALATGDFNHDGRDDVAVGDPGEDSATGAVMVLRGTSSVALLTSTGRQIWTQSSTGIGGAGETGDDFGATLATGDFKGNTRTDLAIGVPYETIGDARDAGAVNVIYSAGSTGLASAGNQLLSMSSLALGPVAGFARFGQGLAAGDFDGNGRTDLAVGAPGYNDEAGIVGMFTGGTGGLAPAFPSVWSQGSSGVDGTPEALDEFGISLSTLRTISPNHDDLLVSVIGEQFSDPQACDSIEPVIYPVRVGLVEFLPGSANGLLTSFESSAWDDFTDGVKQAPQPCGFGDAVG